MKRVRSSRLYRKACRVLVGGVSSPARSFKAVGGSPVFFAEGRGSSLKDVDGNRYVDYCQSWGALILGHAHPNVVRALARQAAKGTSFGASIPLEAELAEAIRRFFPSCEKIRFTSSGTEAVMTAVRLARGATGKNRILKFEGCYHGHSDALLVKGGSGLATLGIPSSKGVPPAAAGQTTVLPFNAAEPLEAAFRKFRDIAAVILEPVAGNMGLVPAEPEFLQTVRRLTRRTEAVLIFDEVITGFRVSLQGAQGLYGIRPDLTTLGKVIGGGLPIGAVGGPSRLMKNLAPEGLVYQAGTLSGNPLSLRAGLETLRLLSRRGEFPGLERQTRSLARSLESALGRSGIPVSVPHVGSAFSIFFCKKPPRRFREITPAHVRTYRRFFRHMLERGIYLPPSAYEAMFVSTAHTGADFDKTLDAAEAFRV